MTVVINGTTGISPVSAAGTSASIDGLTVGRGAGEVATNTVVGNGALASGSQSGGGNNAFGQYALAVNTSGATNNAYGNETLYANTTGSAGAAFGHKALWSNTTGSNNVGVGYNALYSNTTASNNTAVGYQAMYTNTTGTGTAVGKYALYYSNGAANVAIGGNTGTDTAALQNTTSGSYNTALGVAALAQNTTASENTAVGYQALYANTASYNVAVGAYSLKNNTTGAYNVAIGTETAGSNSVLYANTTGSYNVGIGTSVLASNTTGYSNTSLGYVSGYSLTTGYLNTFVGKDAGYYVTTGAKNTILGCYTGNQGGLDIRTSSNKIVLSDGDGNPLAVCGAHPNGAGSYVGDSNGWTFGTGGTATTYDGFIALNGPSAAGYGPTIYGYSNGSIAWVVGSYGFTKGGSSKELLCMNTSGGVYLSGAGATSWTTASDERLKENLVEITNAAYKVSTLRAVIGNFKSDEEKIRKPFLIAQDVQAVLPEAVTSSAQSKDDPTEYLGVSYTEVIPLLVAAIKELKAEFDAYKATHP